MGSGASWTTAQANCNADQNGWLAVLDTPALATGIVTFFSLSVPDVDVYFGLYKTTSCVTTACTTNDYLRWDVRGGETASTTGYTANMKS